ncbi:hypothetical protein BUALT_Bualt02G0086200 [Buddleja alternifolia]|uniref:UBC core domain-containing protein n=1 Tax=Buddleja alternifolia TaxID=168488 RepID=A0AAV6Y0Q9_9LAMI|nr:hypothetical protein BUALT_Bualt02G0086200 [Buddleja alternifolia]
MATSLSSTACRRIIQRQMRELQNQSFVVEVGPILEDIYHWHTTILGPPNSPFSGGKFVLNINFQPEHPLKAPMVRFQTKIFHPNISSRSGGISMRILREYWTSSITMLNIEPILDEAHPDVADTAEMYKNDRAMYDSTAQSWTELYAMERNFQ